MAILKTFKVTALPTPLLANAIYYVKDGVDHFQIYFTDESGEIAYKAYADSKSFSFNTYTLPIGTTTGVLNLAENQIFKLDTSTAGVKTISFTNPPSKAMVVVLECVGGLSTISLPSTVTVVDGVDATLGAARSILTIFYDAEKYFLINNSKIAA